MAYGAAEKLVIREIGVAISLGVLSGIAWKMHHWGDMKQIKKWYIQEKKIKATA
ncbi:mitochondrial hypothetical protein [Andalucia godoyi]|uniref:Cytochrome c oxidase subunit 5C n=1 Tax=Andalucia godoyi TaxID=505711 RepID=A0A8K0F2G9_ANDGO|nr:mitochondrial hypothetical protein [Andalucia godoyi]|eukprot:ANDGO_07147.mRNA.1 mitochondrial hypothetical protein